MFRARVIKPMKTPSNECPSLRIFLVENHPDTMNYLRLFLENLGHTVFAAFDLAEAAAKLPAADCDVVISDIGLPDGEGWELFQRAKLSRPIYAIAMSGLGLNADRERSKAAGFRHHLLKPFDFSELQGMLDEAAREQTAA